MLHEGESFAEGMTRGREAFGQIDRIHDELISMHFSYELERIDVRLALAKKNNHSFSDWGMKDGKPVMIH